MRRGDLDERTGDEELVTPLRKDLPERQSPSSAERTPEDAPVGPADVEREQISPGEGGSGVETPPRLDPAERTP